jgi:hypothetical protein
MEVLDDDALFAGEDNEEDESAFVIGGFSDSLGDDFLGLQELGIAAELGLSSLAIPKKLLKGNHRAQQGLLLSTSCPSRLLICCLIFSALRAKPKEPPPPYPLPPSLLPITSKNVGDQIDIYVVLSTLPTHIPVYLKLGCTNHAIIFVLFGHYTPLWSHESRQRTTTCSVIHRC